MTATPPSDITLVVQTDVETGTQRVSYLHGRVVREDLPRFLNGSTVYSYVPAEFEFCSSFSEKNLTHHMSRIDEDFWRRVVHHTINDVSVGDMNEQRVLLIKATRNTDSAVKLYALTNLATHNTSYIDETLYKHIYTILDDHATFY
jgi:hypothetical protein